MIELETQFKSTHYYLLKMKELYIRQENPCDPIAMLLIEEMILPPCLSSKVVTKKIPNDPVLAPPRSK
jgi:hypothetical protein